MIRALGFLAATFAVTTDTNGAMPPEAQGSAGLDEGPRLYQRCAACHLPDGRGVPGAYPTLAGRLGHAASSDRGRTYLAMTVIAGVMGPIEVDGKRFMGVMPAQAGLTDEDVAAVLNFAVDLQAPGTAAPQVRLERFTTEEVAAIRAAHPQASPHTVLALRAGVFDDAKSPAPDPQ